MEEDKKIEGLVSAMEISKIFGISYQTVNYYTNLGILRTKEVKGNRRLYDLEETRKRLDLVRKYKKKGYPLRVIRDELL